MEKTMTSNRKPNEMLENMVQILLKKDRLTVNTLTKGNHRVTLIGVQHIGSESYYQRVLSKLNPQATATMMEGITDHQKISKVQMTDYSQLTLGTGLRKQKDFINKDSVSNPIHADFDISQLNYLEKRLFENFSQKLNTTLDVICGKKTLKLPALLANGTVLFIHYRFLLRDFILHRRNKYVVKHVMEVVDKNETSNTDVIWGAAHSPGLIKLLIKQGFSEET